VALFRRGGETGFLIEDGTDSRTLVVTGDWTGRAAKALRAGDADGLILNYARGYREPDLTFLEDWPLRRLQVLARTVTDIEPIYRLADTLEDLDLTTAPGAIIDLGRFPRLRSVGTEDWHQIRRSLTGAPQLRRAGVYGYAESDLLPFSENAMLTSLHLKQAPRLQSLLGIEGMTALDRLSVAGANRLTDLSSLPSVSSSLRDLRLDSCLDITSLDELSSLQALSTLWVANCGNIDSLLPIGSLTHLTTLYLYMSTRIVDGDLEPLIGLRGLRDLRIMNRKHYRPTVGAVGKALGLDI